MLLTSTGCGLGVTVIVIVETELVYLSAGHQVPGSGRKHEHPRPLSIVRIVQVLFRTKLQFNLSEVPHLYTTHQVPSEFFETTTLGPAAVWVGKLSDLIYKTRDAIIEK